MPSRQGNVFYCHGRIPTQVVSERKVVTFLLGAAHTQMNVVRARPLGGTLKEGIYEIEHTERKVRVA